MAQLTALCCQGTTVVVSPPLEASPEHLGVGFALGDAMLGGENTDTGHLETVFLAELPGVPLGFGDFSLGDSYETLIPFPVAADVEIRMADPLQELSSLGMVFGETVVGGSFPPDDDNIWRY